MINTSTGDGSRSGADRAAHERSVGLGVAEIAAELQAQLGQVLLGVIVGKNARTLARSEFVKVDEASVSLGG